MLENIPILSILIWLPLLAAIVLIGVRSDAAVRWVTLVATLIVGVLSVVLFFEFSPPAAPALSFEENYSWIPQFGIRYQLGIDGIALTMVTLTGILSPLAVLCSWTAIQKRVKGFFIALLFLETGMMGVFCASDLFLFYVFWEVMLLPMALMIGVWGGPRRLYAAVKFVLFTMVGSLLMFVAILYCYMTIAPEAGVGTFNIVEWQTLLPAAIPADIQLWLFGAFALSFAIKVPMFPLHTWLPDAHVEAPTAGSVILAGVLL